MRWFGHGWGAPVCDDGQHVPTPVGQPCEHCTREIDDGDRGLVLVYYERVVRDYPVHLDCLLSMVGVER